MSITTPHATNLVVIRSPLLFAEQAGSYLQVHPRTLANWRVLGKGPRYIRSGNRALYRQADLDVWLDQHTFQHMADERARRARA
jgi:hypothetical protein